MAAVCKDHKKDKKESDDETRGKSFKPQRQTKVVKAKDQESTQAAADTNEG
jgi:hypothetical protein